MKNLYNLATYIESFPMSPLACFSDLSPWEITSNSSQCVRELMASALSKEFGS